MTTAADLLAFARFHGVEVVQREDGRLACHGADAAVATLRPELVAAKAELLAILAGERTGQRIEPRNVCPWPDGSCPCGSVAR